MRLQCVGSRSGKNRTMMIVGVLLFPLLLPALLAQNDTEYCRKDLGMHSGDIPDEAVTASSSYDEKSVGPANARVRVERNGGAWCPGVPISRDVYEWLQIDLGRLQVVTQVETQGRFGNGQGQEFAPSYLFEYRREEGEQWIRYKDRKGTEILKGNSNTYLAELRELNPPVVARAVRFVPYSNHPRTICIRVELYGCPWTDGVVSYDMRQGDKRGGGELDFSDFTYDGHVENGHLSGGLGQLTDGQLGNTQFRLDLQLIGRRGFEWVAWKNDSAAAEPVEITFRFDRVRNFSAILIHANNLFTKEIGVFRVAYVYFSVGGHYYAEVREVYESTRDVVSEQARYVLIPIPHRVAQHVKVVLLFDARWIMVSEVRFVSEVVNGSVEEEAEPKPPTLVSTDGVAVMMLSTEPFAVINHTAYIPTNASISCETEVGVFNGHIEFASDAPPVVRDEKDSFVAILLGTFGALFVLTTITAFIFLLRYRRKKFNSPLKSMFIGDHMNSDLNYLSSQGGKVLNGNVYNSIASNDFQDASKDGVLYKAGCSRHGGEQTESHYMKIPESLSIINCKAENFSNSASEAGVNARAANCRKNLMWTPNFESFPTAMSNQSSGNAECALGQNCASAFSGLFNFAPEKLRFIEKLGDGTFGEVHICDVTDLPGKLEQRFSSSQCCHQTNAGSMLVAVRMLRDQATDEERVYFEKEIRLLSNLVDPNLLQTLGVCRSSALWAVVTEYTALGSLRQFLSQRTLETLPQKRGSTVQLSLSPGCLIYLATQIASGMKYLESLSLVHLDLATRNCLIGHRFVVKVADLGTSRGLYPGDYYQGEPVGSAALPIRWMSWESALLKKYSCKSDVWSFGVTLWELWTMARLCPFHDLSDDQVLTNFRHYLRPDTTQPLAIHPQPLSVSPQPLGVPLRAPRVLPQPLGLSPVATQAPRVLPQPPGCPKEIYDLMAECWSREETRRPAFREMHMFLSRKNVGYSPLAERANCCEQRVVVA